MGCSASKEKKGQRVQPSKVQVKEHEGVTAGVPQPVRPSKEGPAWDEHDHLVSTVAPPPPSAVAGGAAYLSIPLFASANRTKPSYPVSAWVGASQENSASVPVACNSCEEGGLGSHRVPAKGVSYGGIPTGTDLCRAASKGTHAGLLQVEKGTEFRSRFRDFCT